MLPALSQNEYFKSLYDGLTSNEPSIKRKSKNYFENIRKYNSSFAMVSLEAVSYTHLDVYKRQDYNQASIRQQSDDFLNKFNDFKFTLLTAFLEPRIFSCLLYTSRCV